MTVQELIDILNEVEDKTLPVMLENEWGLTGDVDVSTLNPAGVVLY